MSNSDTPLTSEEKWTAYVDGRLGPEEADAFEKEHPGAPDEKSALFRIAQALRTNSNAPALRNPDFFNSSILRTIQAVEAPANAARNRPAPWSLWRMALAGACCIAAAGAIYAIFVKGADQHREKYVANVLWAKPGDRQLHAAVLDADGIAVVWITGLDPLPNDYVLQ